ncbi:hypothetical protein QFC22_004402 [Naganishia vaughanmartiniae]|uniref:Uncharacterized protein n=1 Tax=Naganishia vaughanmartiniae TaxID=1424756 RepID=A0ACC2X2N8_9TREE|nr:hypothetical protein QFC22_004402 [Naganishia vaughanmartiniae]
MSRTTIVSAPGKVLLTGGYLVLDPKYTGLVIATSSRFYSVVRTQPVSSASQATAGRITVKAPQFNNATWEYAVSTGDGADVTVQPIASGNGKNKFVEIALQKTLALIQALKGQPQADSIIHQGSNLEIVIVGDNDFYSQRQALEALSLPATMASLGQLEPFAAQNTTLAAVHKTGLGSSAALITSLVTALLQHFELSPDLDLVHNMAQYVHCLAQGKVGSGFDVCSAVKGSQVYRRFDEQVLRTLMDKTLVTGQEILDTVRPSPSWTTQTTPIALPPLLRLVLADVDAGSDTPSFVGKVLKWRKDNPEAALAAWTKLNDYNSAVEHCLRSLSSFAAQDPDNYRMAIRSVMNGQTATPESKVDHISRALHELRNSLQNVRRAMKMMGQANDVPIEPDEQTRLLDACLEIPGVIGGGVPGAGGYDAIYLLILEPDDSATEASADSVIAEVEALWQGWKELSVCPLSSRADAGGLKVVRKLEDVKGLKKAVETAFS